MYHLQYANDLKLLMTGGIKDLRIFKLILYLFEGIFTLAINFQKSRLYPTKRGSLPDPASTYMLKCSAAQLSVIYFGIPISGRNPRCQDWMTLTQ